MGNSAEIAKERLKRISFGEWLERVDMLLTVGGYSVTQLADAPWRRYYNAGIKPGRVAEIIFEAGRRVADQ